MSNMSVYLIAGAIAAAVAGGGLFGYSQIGNGSAPEAKVKVSPYHAKLENSCLSTLNQAMGNNKLMKFYIGGAIKNICACTAVGALEGRKEREAKVITALLPLRLTAQIERNALRRERNKEIKKAKSKNHRELLKTRAERAEKKWEKKIRRRVKKAVSNSGMNLKAVMTLVQQAEKDGMACLARKGA